MSIDLSKYTVKEPEFKKIEMTEEEIIASAKVFNEEMKKAKREFLAKEKRSYLSARQLILTD